MTHHEIKQALLKSGSRVLPVVFESDLLIASFKADSTTAGQVRALITKLQDGHAEALRKCDPYISQVLELERREGGQLPGFVMAGPAPMGA